MEDISKTVEELGRTVACVQEELTSFVSTPEFQGMLTEMYALPAHLQHEFVELVCLDENALRARGLEVPEGLVIQRSEFGDKRPTLFCVTKVLPPGLGWHKVTITFDNEGRSGVLEPSPSS